jgi:hypothetical protein
LTSDAAGHTDEPAPHRCRLSHRLGPTCQHEEYSLKGIIGRREANESPTNSQNGRTMSTNEFLECRFISLRDKLNEKIGIR